MFAIFKKKNPVKSWENKGVYKVAMLKLEDVVGGHLCGSVS